MVRYAKTAYHIHRLQNATTRTIWKTIQRHSTHKKPIPPLEGQSDFGDKCKALQNTLFPPVNMDPGTALPPDLLTDTRDIRHHTRPVTICYTQNATGLEFRYGSGQEGIGNSSHGLRTAYRDQSTDSVRVRLGSTDSAAPGNPCAKYWHRPGKRKRCRSGRQPWWSS